MIFSWHLLLRLGSRYGLQDAWWDIHRLGHPPFVSLDRCHTGASLIESRRPAPVFSRPFPRIPTISLLSSLQAEAQVYDSKDHHYIMIIIMNNSTVVNSKSNSKVELPVKLGGGWCINLLNFAATLICCHNHDLSERLWMSIHLWGAFVPFFLI